MVQLYCYSLFTYKIVLVPVTGGFKINIYIYIDTALTNEKFDRIYYFLLCGDICKAYTYDLILLLERVMIGYSVSNALFSIR